MRNNWLLQRNTSLKYLLILAIMPLFFLSSCEKDYGKKQETTKELKAISSSKATVANGGSITFTDLSLGVENRLWTFPGGDPATSDKPEVEVIFSDEGAITPSLKVVYYDGTTETMNFAITVFPILVAGFDMSATKIKVGESVTFTDKSIGQPTGWNWEFEGGVPATSTDQNPTVVFNVNNPVKVKLTISRAADGSTATKEASLQVGPPELCLNGNFETGIGNAVDWQTWKGSAFPYTVVAGGANGTDFTSFIDFKGAWGWGQIISRDFPNNMIALENGHEYTVSMYVRAESPIRLDVFRGVNHLPEWSPVFAKTGVAEGYEEFYDISGLTLPLNITTTWTKVSIRVIVPDNGKTRSNFFPDIILGGDADSKVYIDEISVKIVE